MKCEVNNVMKCASKNVRSHVCRKHEKDIFESTNSYQRIGMILEPASDNDHGFRWNQIIPIRIRQNMEKISITSYFHPLISLSLCSADDDNSNNNMM